MDFNKQAHNYEGRSKLPSELPKAISKELGSYVNLNSSTKILEIGTGTGEIGVEIAALSYDYIGFDKSQSMINIYTAKLPSNLSNVVIIPSDGDKPWPVDDNSIDVLFSSKALHLLNQDHVMKEMERITSVNGLSVIIGSIRKDPEGIDAIMRKKMRQLLNDNELIGKGGNEQRKKFYDRCVKNDAQLLKKIDVLKWEINHSPLDSINSWKSVEGLAGNQVDTQLKDEIISELENWAYNKFGDLSKKTKSYKQYELSGVFFSKK